MGPAWTREGDRLHARVAVHPSMRETATAYLLHRLRLLRARADGFHHPLDVTLDADRLVATYAPRALDARLPDVGPRVWQDHALPLLVALDHSHACGATGLGVAGTRWIAPVSWFLPSAAADAREARRRADLQLARDWLRDVLTGARLDPGERAAAEAIAAVLADGDPHRLTRLIRDERVRVARRADTDPPPPSFLTLLTEAELLERVATLYRYRLLRPEEARAHGLAGLVLEVDRGWKDPHFEGIRRPSPQEVWDAIVRESRVTPLLALSADLPNPLDGRLRGAVVARWEGLHEDQPLLYVDTDGARIPPTGFARLHLAGDNALMGRKRVFTAFAGAHPSLGGLLADPPPIRPFARNARRRDDLEDAILATRGIFAVQGPPGTGKTHLATEVVRRLFRRDAGARVLVCAKEHFALDHIARKIGDALAADGVPMRGWRSVSLAKRRRGKEGVDATWQGPRVVQDLSTRAWAPEAAAWAHWENRAAVPCDERLASLGRHAANLFFATTQDGSMVEALGDQSFDLVVVEEAGKCYPSELLHALCLGRTALAIGDHLQLPPFQEQRTRENVEVWRQTIRRARQDDRLARELADRFGPLWASMRALADARGPLTDEEKAWLRPFAFLFDRLDARHRLEEQFRLEAPLSRVVGSVFYDRPFVHRKPELVAAGKVAADPLEGVIPRDLDVPLLWLDTPHMTELPDATEDPAKRGDRDNRYERDVVLGYLRRLAPARPVDLVILTPYNAQKDLLLDSPELKAVCERLTRRPFAETVRTTDEYQGREAELVVLSLVRNNSLGDRAWGFMTERERLNVMFSRARFRLVVVGSSAHIERHGADCEWLLKVWRAWQKEARDPSCARIRPAREVLRG